MARHLTIYSSNPANGRNVRFACWFNDDGSLDSTTEAWLTESESAENVTSIEAAVRPYLPSAVPIVFDWQAPNGTVRRCVLSPDGAAWSLPNGRETPVGPVVTPVSA